MSFISFTLALNIPLKAERSLFILSNKDGRFPISASLLFSLDLLKFREKEKNQISRTIIIAPAVEAQRISNLFFLG